MFDGTDSEGPDEIAETPRQRENGRLRNRQIQRSTALVAQIVENGLSWGMFLENGWKAMNLKWPYEQQL